MKVAVPIRDDRLDSHFGHAERFALLSLAGGVAGLVVAAVLTAGLTLLVPGFLPVLPAWAVAFGLLSSSATGVVAGYLPARQAAAMDPVEALRHE